MLRLFESYRDVKLYAIYMYIYTEHKHKFASQINI